MKTLDNHNIELSSVDFVRFSWATNQNEHMFGEQETRYVTPATIWVGVLPNSTSGARAQLVTQDILGVLQDFDVHDVDIAWRESQHDLLSSEPPLYPPASRFNRLRLLRGFIDPVSTSLSLPIAHAKNASQWGSLGFYFEAGEKLYAVTARHVLFKDVRGNNEPYKYIGMFFLGAMWPMMWGNADHLHTYRRA